MCFHLLLKRPGVSGNILLKTKIKKVLKKFMLVATEVWKEVQLLTVAAAMAAATVTTKNPTTHLEDPDECSTAKTTIYKANAHAAVTRTNINDGSYQGLCFMQNTCHYYPLPPF